MVFNEFLNRKLIVLTGGYRMVFLFVHFKLLANSEKNFKKSNNKV